MLAGGGAVGVGGRCPTRALAAARDAFGHGPLTSHTCFAGLVSHAAQLLIMTSVTGTAGCSLHHEVVGGLGHLYCGCHCRCLGRDTMMLSLVMTPGSAGWGSVWETSRPTHIRRATLSATCCCRCRCRCPRGNKSKAQTDNILITILEHLKSHQDSYSYYSPLRAVILLPLRGHICSPLFKI